MRVVAIIPAYNEEETLGDVIDVVRSSLYVDEVIVISDGSTDSTAAVAFTHGAHCIELHENVGKGGALQAGINRADADVYLFLDADLIGLTTGHVEKLLAPVILYEAEMSVGVFGNGRVATDLAQKVAPYLSGQRAVRRETLQAVSDMDTCRFGVEIALTRHIKEKRISVRHVLLSNLTHRMKEEKLGLIRGFVARMKMYWEIMRIVQRSS